MARHPRTLTGLFAHVAGRVLRDLQPVAVDLAVQLAEQEAARVVHRAKAKRLARDLDAVGHELRDALAEETVGTVNGEPVRVTVERPPEGPPRRR